MGLFWTLSFQLSNPHYCPQLYCTLIKGTFLMHDEGKSLLIEVTSTQCAETIYYYKLIKQYFFEI